MSKYSFRNPFYSVFNEILLVNLNSLVNPGKYLFCVHFGETKERDCLDI